MTFPSPIGSVPRPRLAACLAIATAVALLVPSLAEAHTVGLSRSTYRATATGVDAEIQLARSDALAFAPWIDADANGTIEPGEATIASERFASEAFALVDVTRPLPDGSAVTCKLDRADASLAEEDGMIARGTFLCAQPDAGIVVETRRLMEALPRGHRAITQVTPPGAAESTEAMLHRAATSVRAEPVVAGAAPSPPRALGAILGEYFVLGIEHILTGVDHIVFLLGLLLLGGRLKPILWMITAFTVAHSITLGLAVLGVVAPSGSFIEPMIALSVAYVGVENFVVKDVDKRWRITALFGLVHGFGFAGALGEIALPRAQIPAALVSFNLGVEVGQLALLALALPVILKLRERAWFRDNGVRIASAAIVLAGVIWFVTRIVGA